MNNTVFSNSISKTAICALGIAMVGFSYNDTPAIESDFSYLDDVKPIYAYADKNYSTSIDSDFVDFNALNNDYCRRDNKIESEASYLFGEMRSATEEEIKGISNYISSISVDTGINFYNYVK